MPQLVPGDPLRRAWIEVAGANPTLVDEYRPSLVAFLAFDHNHVAQHVGTGFVMCGSADMSIVLTARHVLEGVARAQRPGQLTSLRLGPHDLRAVWMGPGYASFLHVVHATYSPKTDLAACIVVPQDHDRALFAPVSVPIHTAVPAVGDVVHMVSANKVQVTELAPPERHDKRGQVLSIVRPISIRIGTITEVHPVGVRHYSWPCFTTSIPAEPGMSGGYVFLPRHGVTVAACGVVSADSFSGEARTDQMQSGSSIIACTWPALGLLIPQEIGGVEAPRYRSLLDMIQSGDVPEPEGSIAGFRLLSDPNGTTWIERRIV